MLALATAEFDRLFPFHIRFDRTGRLISVGSSLQRVSTEAREAEQLTQLVALRRPRRASTFELLSGRISGRVVHLEVCDSALLLRGEVIDLGEDASLCFVGSPWIEDAEAMRSSGLVAADFSRHDPTNDLLILLGTARKSLEQARRLGRELEERQEHLEEARRDAEEANRAKSDFLAILSHEIRTPMNGLGSMVDLLRDTPLTEEQRGFTDVILSCSEALSCLLNDILDVSKVEAGRLDLESIEFSPGELVAEVAALYRTTAEERSVELEAWIPPDVPARVLGDPTRVRQVLSNLVGNAVKFTASGEIVLAVRDVAEGDGEVELDFAVYDTGPGVPEEARARIFEPFCQADSTTTRRHGGTGLGLTICRLLADRMRGRIALEHASPEGSTFTLRLPFAHAEGHTPRPRPGVERAGAGSVSLRRALADLGLPEVEAGGDVLVAAADGDASAVEARAAGRPVLIDGARERTPKAWSQVTGPGLAPWVRALAAALPRTTTARRRRDETFPRWEGVRVLVAEDVPTNRRVAESLLRRLGIVPVFAHDGAEALRALEREPFHVVLLDIEMPELDGYEVARRWRLQEKTRDGRTPLLALTAHALSESRQRAIEAGMDEVLTKPIRLRPLAEALERWLPAPRARSA
ncbi:MAG: ATP-binding protein [Planctomycetota bacterium]